MGANSCKQNQELSRTNFSAPWILSWGPWALRQRVLAPECEATEMGAPPGCHSLHCTVEKRALTRLEGGWRQAGNIPWFSGVHISGSFSSTAVNAVSAFSSIASASFVAVRLQSIEVCAHCMRHALLYEGQRAVTPDSHHANQRIKHSFCDITHLASLHLGSEHICDLGAHVRCALGMPVRCDLDLGVRVRVRCDFGVRVRCDLGVRVRVRCDLDLGVRVHRDLGVRVHVRCDLGVHVRCDLGMPVRCDLDLGVRVHLDLGVRVRVRCDLGVHVCCDLGVCVYALRHCYACALVTLVCM